MTLPRTAPDGAEELSVTHVIKGLGPGGAERLIVNQINASADPGIRYRIVSLIPEKTHLIEMLADDRVDVSVIGGGIAWPWRLRARLRTDTDVVHVHSPLLAGVTRLLARLGGVRAKVITTEHNRWPRHHAATRFLNRLTLPLDDETIAVSADVRDSMPRRAHARIDVLRHGIPVDEIASFTAARAEVRGELGLDGPVLVIGIVANFRPEKGYDTLVRAATIAARADPDLRWVIVGQGPGEADVAAAVSAAGLGECMVLTGYRSDAPRVMSAFDIFSLASRHEGLPVSLMEALALGLPVVATSAGGIPEAVTDGVEGRLVPIDDAESLAAAWLELAADEPLRSKMGQAARAGADTFDVSATTAELEARYRRLARRDDEPPKPRAASS